MEIQYILEVHVIESDYNNNYYHDHHFCTSLIIYISCIGSVRSPPATLPSVCVGPSTSPQHQGRVNISWDPLPCHLQNGADVTSYTIQYTRLSTGVAARISSFHRGVNCSQAVDGLYSCVVAESLIPSDQAYSIHCWSCCSKQLWRGFIQWSYQCNSSSIQ